MDMLHIDLLLCILRRLSPRSLAVSRCVCTAWRAAVDHHRLLRADLLPLSVHAAIYDELDMDDKPPMLFGRRSATSHITSNLQYQYLVDDPTGYDYVNIQDHCNGLLLVRCNHERTKVEVVNLATRQWAALPLMPCACRGPNTRCGRCCHNNRYLVYDPTVSPHYQVLFIPCIPRDATSGTDWPPTPYVMPVFSSTANCWKETSFVREGDAAGTIEDVNSCCYCDVRMYNAAYWKGSLYVPSRLIKHDFLLRINLSSHKYQVIKLPKGVGGGYSHDFQVGKSKKGVYCVVRVPRCNAKFQVWFLHESSCGLTDWVFRNEINLEPAFSKQDYHSTGPWIPQSPKQIGLVLKNDVNLKLVDEYNEALAEDDFDWDSDNENVVSIADWPVNDDPSIGGPYCLGFHPYKEIILFNERELCRCSAVAYYLNSSKVRYLGNMLSRSYDSMEEISFAYTPCWMMDLPGSN